MSLGLDACEVRLCPPCVRVGACVPRLPSVFLPVGMSRVCPGSPRCLFTVGMPAEEGDERVAILADEDSRAQLQLTATCIWGRLLRRAVSWLLVAMVVVLLLPVWWPVSFPWWLPIHGAPEWPGTVEQWRAARADIDLKHTDVGAFQLEEAALPAYLSNFHPAGPSGCCRRRSSGWPSTLADGFK